MINKKNDEQKNIKYNINTNYEWQIYSNINKNCPNEDIWTHNIFIVDIRDIIIIVLFWQSEWYIEVSYDDFMKNYMDPFDDDLASNNYGNFIK